MSSDRSLNVAFVHILKQQQMLTADVTAPPNVAIDCRSRLLAKGVLLNTTTHGDNCSTFREGDVHNGKLDGSTDTIAAVKMSRYLNGAYSDIYISPADYDNFITKCNACCGS